jgi:hypothetical protein
VKKCEENREGENFFKYLNRNKTIEMHLDVVAQM